MNSLRPDGTRRRASVPDDASEAMPLLDFAESPKETRKAAFIASKPKLGDRCKIVLRFIDEQGSYGATMHEASVGTGILLQSICGVFRELKKRNCIRHNNEKRPTPTGSLAAVVVATGSSDE